MFKIIKILGESLSPDYQSGDFVLLLQHGKIRVGDIVVFQQPGYGMLIKRVHGILADENQFDVRGSVPESVDSRTFGMIKRAQITGKVIWHIRRKP